MEISILKTIPGHYEVEITRFFHSLFSGTVTFQLQSFENKFLSREDAVHFIRHDLGVDDAECIDL